MKHEGVCAVCEDFPSMIRLNAGNEFMAQKRLKKLSLEEAAKKLAAIAEQHLSALPEEERDARVASFARVKFETSRGGCGTQNVAAPKGWAIRP